MYERTRTISRLFVILLVTMGWFRRIGNQVSTANLAGMVAGMIGIIISFTGRGLVPGRELGDPLPLVLTIQHMFRGTFLYLNWRGLLWPLLFFGFIALLSTILLYFLSFNQGWEIEDARGAARLAAGITVGVVAITKVDAVIVAIWYLLAGFVAILITGFVASQITRIFLSRASHS